MILKVFAIYDSAVGAYMQPFFMQSKGAAIRAFKDHANDRESQTAKHPSDFTLFELGSYNDENGFFENLTTPLSLGTAFEHVTKEEVPTAASIRKSLEQKISQDRLQKERTI